jgi:hypothetical protein
MAAVFVGYAVQLRLRDGRQVHGTVAAVDTATQALQLRHGASVSLCGMAGGRASRASVLTRDRVIQQPSTAPGALRKPRPS